MHCAMTAWPSPTYSFVAFRTIVETNPIDCGRPGPTLSCSALHVQTDIVDQDGRVGFDRSQVKDTGRHTQMNLYLIPQLAESGFFSDVSTCNSSRWASNDGGSC